MISGNTTQVAACKMIIWNIMHFHIQRLQCTNR